MEQGHKLVRFISYSAYVIFPVVIAMNFSSPRRIFFSPSRKQAGTRLWGLFQDVFSSRPFIPSLERLMPALLLLFDRDGNV